MKYVKLGNTDIEISRIGIGGMSFGQAFEDFHLWTLDQKKTTEMIGHAYDLGVNFIDTANQYAHGTSEEYIGKAIKELGIPRDKIILGSKVYFNEGKLSKEAINREIEGTLERLNTDYLDLYQIHRFDYDTPIEETLEALDGLVKSGKIRALGASAMYGYQFHNMQLCAEEHGFTKFSTMQNHYNLLYREDERELIPICEQYGVTRIPYSPLAGGHLTRREWDNHSLRNDTDSINKRKYDYAMENDMQIVQRVAEIADKHQVSMAQIALAWQYARGVGAPIVGATNRKHFDDAVKGMDVVLTEDEVKYLEELYYPHKISGAR